MGKCVFMKTLLYNLPFILMYVTLSIWGCYMQNKNSNKNLHPNIKTLKAIPGSNKIINHNSILHNTLHFYILSNSVLKLNTNNIGLYV